MSLAVNVRKQSPVSRARCLPSLPCWILQLQQRQEQPGDLKEEPGEMLTTEKEPGPGWGGREKRPHPQDEAQRGMEQAAPGSYTGSQLPPADRGTDQLPQSRGNETCDVN